MQNDAVSRKAPRRFLITSALPYINGIKHLGNLAGSMLPADVHARFRRMQGHEVLFICATDEHGTPAELAAEQAKLDVARYCELQHELQRRVSSSFGLSFDHFGRSSSPQNHRLTQHFAERLERNGLIEERQSQQVYSKSENRFLPDRYVEGTCPRCAFQNARGDQCESCGALLDPADLLNPRSKISGSMNLELRPSRHLYLLQGKLTERLRRWIDLAEHWPVLARSIAYKWLDEGLKDRSITRDLAWGIPVAYHGRSRGGFESKVFYVWFDAPIAYIAATKEWAEENNLDWRKWWCLDDGAGDTEYIQFMGKDNVAFHTVSFPATLIGSEEPWKLVDRLKAFNWLTWYGGKFSTSERRGVFMDQALELLPADCWRWYLIANSPESADASFTWDHLQAVVNSDLANVLGNFVNRIMSFAERHSASRVPQEWEWGDEEESLGHQLETRLSRLSQLHGDMEFRKAASETRALWALGNEYLTKAAPWSAIKTDKARALTSVRVALNLARIFALISLPILPSTARRLLKALGEADELPVWPSGKAEDFLDQLQPGQCLRDPGILFERISEEQLARFSSLYPGTESVSA
ncbi:methionine--tRNA ligase [Pelagibius litoralis]|uniref:Methionine--tRNA ligase n=1 Tax=Pelagibius litoralis TaxID=374515 RepID=A0A967F3B3_9PROT|nr:methionine--tRNA ligase [Pelagibius litoralis]